MQSSVFGAILAWFGYLLVFLLLGGLGAGLSAEGYELVTGYEFSGTLYAVIFGASGLLGVWLVRDARTAEGP